jgi:hypothetical protein
MYTKIPFCCMLYNENANGCLWERDIKQTYEVPHTTSDVLVANALSNSDITNYLILIYQGKMSEWDM